MFCFILVQTKINLNCLKAGLYFWDWLYILLIGLELWCLTPLSTVFQLYRCGQSLLVEETGVPRENHRPVASH